MQSSPICHNQLQPLWYEENLSLYLQARKKICEKNHIFGSYQKSLEKTFKLKLCIFYGHLKDQVAVPNRRQQQLQTAANGRKGDPGGQFTLRGGQTPTLGRNERRVHLHIFPCFSFKGKMIRTLNLYFLMMFHVTSSGVKSKLKLNFQT